jgi:Protein of unknown function (DUF2721)
MPNNFMVDQLSQVISQATAPAFLLAAVAAFVSLLVGRLNRISDRGAALVAVCDNSNSGPSNGRIHRLARRAALVNRAIEFAVLSGICTTILVLVAFASALIGLSHVYGAAVLFFAAVALLATSLSCLWLEVCLSFSGVESFYG